MAMYAKVRRMRFRDGLSISDHTPHKFVEKHREDLAAVAGPQQDVVRATGRWLDCADLAGEFQSTPAP